VAGAVGDFRVQISELRFWESRRQGRKGRKGGRGRKGRKGKKGRKGR